MDLCAISDRGQVRAINQDVCQTWQDESGAVTVLVVCDGMGGARAGNVASSMAAERFMEHVRGCVTPDMNAADVMRCMREAVASANADVFRRSTTDIDCAGMGTTLVGAVVTVNTCVIVNVGDSRAYHATSSRMVQITKDHSVVEDMIDRGDITRDEAYLHPNRNLITRALGTSAAVEPDFFFISLVKGDTLLLCSDGLTSVVDEERIFSEIRNGGDLTAIAQKLILLSIAAGAPDNVTVALCRK
jgi:protein phosphatase